MPALHRSLGFRFRFTAQDGCVMDLRHVASLW